MDFKEIKSQKHYLFDSREESYTFEIDNGKIVNPNKKVPKKPRLRLKIKDTDSGTLKYYDRSKEELQRVFDNCCMTDITTLMNGVLYRCPYAFSLQENNHCHRSP